MVMNPMGSQSVKNHQNPTNLKILKSNISRPWQPWRWREDQTFPFLVHFWRIFRGKLAVTFIGWSFFVGFCWFVTYSVFVLPRKVTWLAGKSSMNENVFPIEKWWFSNVMLVYRGAKFRKNQRPLHLHLHPILLRRDCLDLLVVGGWKHFIPNGCLMVMKSMVERKNTKKT